MRTGATNMGQLGFSLLGNPPPPNTNNIHPPWDQEHRPHITIIWPLPREHKHTFPWTTSINRPYDQWNPPALTIFIQEPDENVKRIQRR